MNNYQTTNIATLKVGSNVIRASTLTSSLLLRHGSTSWSVSFARSPRRIRRGIFRSVRELSQAIYDFLQHYNDNPRSFVWTKTADQILNKLAPLYANRG